MTWEELNKVRDLTKNLRDAERSLELIRLSISAAKVPVRDGMPKATSTDSRIEIATIRIIDFSAKIESLKAELIDAVKILEEQITNAVSNKTARKIFILHYVDCMYFRDIAIALGYSEAHIYYLHRITLENLIKDNSS